MYTPEREDETGDGGADQVFLETGTAFNDAYREVFIQGLLGDQLMDGDALADEFNIRTEGPDNPINQYGLLKAEERFGNGDGVFTVEEQREAYGAYYDLFNGRQYFVDSDQSLRLGVEVVF